MNTLFEIFLKAIHTKFAEIFFVSVAFRHRKRRQVIFIENKFQIAHICDFLRIFKRLIAVGKQLAQFLFTLKIKLLGLEFHPVGIIHRFACLDAQQHILHFRIFPPQIVGIVGHYQRQTSLTGKSHNTLVNRLLFLNAVVLQFQVESVRAKNRR